MIRTLLAALLELKWKILLIVVIFTAGRCLWVWRPAHQVELHQQQFLQAMADRDWSKFDALLDDNFHLPNGHDKKWTQGEAREVLRQFISLKVNATNPEMTVNKSTATVRELIRLDGNGMGYAQMAQQAVNQSSDPFTFTWTHRSWKPWDWTLVTVEHPLLHVSAEE